MNARTPPTVPAPEELEATVLPWGVGEPIYRVYPAEYGPLDFNPSPSSARFRPIRDGKGNVVPTAYGAADVETALAETLLRGVDALASKTPRQLLFEEVRGKMIVALAPRRELRLVRLSGQALGKQGLRREDVIDCEAAHYPYTAEWAQGFHDSSAELMGIAWTSHQNDEGRAFILWEGELDPERDLDVQEAPTALDADPGLKLVSDACAYAGFLFEEP